MKEKVLFLIIGILIGAIIVSGGFILFYKNNMPEMNREKPPMMEMRGENDNFEKRDKEMKNFDFEADGEKNADDIEENSENKKIEKKKKDIKEENAVENIEEKTDDNNQI